MFQPISGTAGKKPASFVRRPENTTRGWVPAGSRDCACKEREAVLNASLRSLTSIGASFKLNRQAEAGHANLKFVPIRSMQYAAAVPPHETTTGA